MQLKKLILCGFKSFADKTELEFGDGVTVVVGPNGCGKSNIIDAVRWVLGEQSAKSLRGGQMLDVIFNGSHTRKSMGMAEVTMVFGNTRGLLNSDLDEVAVTRKLYRSGESEYLMNNKSCRLKDIREMFMDTGVGADAYSIIEQGKVEVLLQSSKQDRRAIFEEAAGISKYKARKKEALRKLERTEQNVLRLVDIISELEKRLRSIKYQAGKARNYQSYTLRLNELRLNQFLAEYHQLQSHSKECEGNLTRQQDDLVGLNSGAEKAQARLSLLDHEIDQCSADIRELENQLLQCTSLISNQEDRIEAGHRRCKELEEILARGSQQLQSLRSQKQKLQEQLGADQDENNQAQQLLDQQQEQLNKQQDFRQEQVLRLNEYRGQMEDEKSGLIDIVRRTAQLHNEISSLDVRRDNLSGQKNRLNDRSGQIRAEIEELVSHRTVLLEKLGKIEGVLEDSQKVMEATRQDLALLSEDRLACSEDLSAAKEYRSGILSRQQLLADLEAKLEGVDQGVRQIIEAKKEDSQEYYYIKGMIAELIRADVKYASIVEAALADKSQHLVATSSQAIIEDMEKLSELRGRVQMLCLDRLPAYHNGYDFSAHPEVQAKLVDLVSFSPDCERLVWHLLGKTILVDSIDSALRLAQITPAGYRWVTLEGEVLEADGTVHLGAQALQAGLISRKSELRDLQKRLAEAEERIRELQNQSEQYASQAQHLEKNLQELRTAIYEANTEKIETRTQSEQVDQNINRLTREQPLISSEIESLEKQIEESLRMQRSSEQGLTDLQSVNDQRQARIDSLEENIHQLEKEDQALETEITNLKVSLGQTQQKRLSLRDRIANTQSQLHQCQHNIDTLQTDITNARANYQSSERAILAAETKISELFHSRQEYQNSERQLRSQGDELKVEKEKLTELARELNVQREQLQEQLHELQMQFNESKLRSENLIERAREELELDLVERFSDYQHEQIDWDEVSSEIEELRQKIHRLGNVNLDAISEQEELEERLEYLQNQHKDLADSKRQLEQLIDKINRESEELFRGNFETIRVNFSELFRKLFGGGRAEIILEDPDNILECGIEVVARPPGKQLQSISLLSGGEKTMTAVALLLAIFKSKPSPFCLLDEVDAALDEANVERFTLVVREFLEDSQFVVITHSRRTMTIADTLYGITMQEQGVSKKVAVRFSGNEVETDTNSAVA